eukprot:jgi/Picsp_1/95/NSC_00095-R1_sap domain-containing protein
MADANLLVNLPSRGLLTGVQAGAVFYSAPASYIAMHDTSPPSSQVVKTDPSSLLIKSLQARKGKKAVAKRDAKGKRSAEQDASGRVVTKKSAVEGSASGSRPSAGGQEQQQGDEGAGQQRNRSELEAKTVKELQSILQSMNLPVSGRKGALVDRLNCQA